jgi:hypothetical protein
MRHLFRVLPLALVWALPGPALAIHAVLASPPPLATLPVVLDRGLKSAKLQAGQPLRAHLVQRVPLSPDTYLPRGATLLGTVEAVSATQWSLRWTALAWRGHTVPVQVRLVAAADAFAVEQTNIPLGGATGRSTSDWTLRQIGGDERMGAGVSGVVYDQYSQPVGRSDGTGVYAPPLRPGAPERALGPFSTTASGLYDLPGWSVRSPGAADAPIVLGVGAGPWQLRAGAAMLLSVAPVE